MALKGYRAYCFRYRWRVGYVFSSFASGGLDTSAGAQLTSYWADDAVFRLGGIRLSVSSTTAGVDATTLLLEIPYAYAGVYEVHAVPGFQSSAEACLEIDALTLVNEPTGMRLSWTAMRVYLDGVLKWSGASGSILSHRYAASGIPLIGVPPILETSGGASPVPVAGSTGSCSAPADFDCAGDAYGKIDYLHEDGGEWVSAPMYAPLPAGPMPEECSCDVDLPEASIISADDQGDCHIRFGNRLVDACERIITNGECDPCGAGTHATTPRIYNRDKVTRDYDTWGGSIWLIPDLEKRVNRWKDANYAETIYRGGFPRVTGNAVATCGEWGGDTDSNVTNPEMYPEVSDILSLVGNATHAIEDVMQRRTIAPAALSRARGRSVHYIDTTITPALCGFGGNPGDLFPVCLIPADETCYASQILNNCNTIQDRVDNPDIIERIDHLDDMCRYVDTICSPHWSYFVWFPANTLDEDGDGQLDSQAQWPVFGDPIGVSYFLAGVRQQYGYQSALPVGEQTRRRMSLPMDPLYTGQLSTLVAASLGSDCHSNWWGQDAFSVWDKQPPTSLAYNSSSASLLTGGNCTVSVGVGGITLTPDPGETALTLDIDLGSFSVFPFGYPLIAASVAVAVDAPNVASWEAQWVSVTGATKRFATANGTYVRPVGVDNAFAFSFQDHGAGYFTDEGVDVHVDGESATLMGSPESVHSFPLIAGRGASKLRFVITAVSDAADVTLDWPTLFMSTDAPKVYDENGFHQIIAWENGPAVRIGNVAWQVGGSISIPPIVQPPGYPPALFTKMGAVDAIATVKWLSGEDPSSVSTEVALFFHASEDGGSLADANGGSVALLIDNPEDTSRRFPLTVMVMSFRETPPSVGFPLRARDAQKMPTGALCQETWSHAEERVLILANRPIHYWSGGAQFTTLLASHVGWSLTGHLQPLTNSEGDYTVQSGAQVLGQCRPWRGLFGITGNASTARNLDVATDPGGLSWWAHVEDGVSAGALKVARALGSLNAGFLGEATAVEGNVSHPSLAFLPYGRLALGYADGSAFKAVYSDDEGATWGSAETLMTGAYGRIWCNDGGDMMRAAVRADGGDYRIYLAFRGSGSAWGSEIALAEGSPVEVENDPFGLAYDYGTGAWMIYARRAGESDRTVFISTDFGATWKEV